MESIDIYEENYTYESLRERDKMGEFDEPSLSQKYDFDLTCKKFIESSYVLDVLNEITPNKMLELINNNKNYEDFQIPLVSGMKRNSKINELADISILSDKNKNSHFNILQNTDILSVIDQDTILENTSRYFLNHQMKDLNNLDINETITFINDMYKSLINKMDINLKDKDLVTYYNKETEKYITEVNFESFGVDDFVRLETSPLDGIKKIVENVNYLDKKFLSIASIEEMLDEGSSVLPSIEKLYNEIYGVNYFTNEDEFKGQVKRDLQYDYLTLNNDIKENKTYLWYIDSSKKSYAIEALDNTKDVAKGNEADKLFGVENKKQKSNEEEM